MRTVKVVALAMGCALLLALAVSVASGWMTLDDDRTLFRTAGWALLGTGVLLLALLAGEFVQRLRSGR